MERQKLSNLAAPWRAANLLNKRGDLAREAPREVQVLGSSIKGI